MSKPLPDSVQQIAEVIGEDAALTLVRCWPRTRSGRPVLYVPATLPADHRLVAIIGWHAAARLVKVFHGEIIFLATCAIVQRDGRNQLIAEALANRASPAAVAIKHGVSERQVRRIAAAMRADISAMDAAGRRGNHSRDIPQASVA
jgi:hypothetical protein